MGPQFFHCGNALIQKNIFMGKCASMGPQFFHCGNGCVGGNIFNKTKASMGPQFFHCGNHDWAVYELRPIFASMGPQFFHCGNLRHTPPLHCRRAPLQWGRSSFTAEILGRGLAIAGGGWASMGPQFFHCGNVAWRQGRSGGRLRFNGAAVLSLRK